MRTIIYNDSDIQEVLDWVETQDVLAFDIETTGLSPREDGIIGFGISSKNEAYYIVHQEFDGNDLLQRVSMGHAIKVLNAISHKKLITWNGSFDTRFTKHYFGVDLISAIWCDAMLTKHTVNEERPFALKEVATMLYGKDAKAEQAEMQASIKANGGSKTEYYKADSITMAKYCMQDCILTFKINEHYLKQLKAEKLEDFYFKDEVMPLYREVTIPMEDRGVKLDMPLLHEVREGISVDIKNLEKQIQDMIQPDLAEFKEYYLWSKYPPRRTGSFAQAIASFAKLPLPRTRSGNYSMTKSNLESLVPDEYSSFLLGGDHLPESVVAKIQAQMWEDEGETYMFNLSSKHHLKRLFFGKYKDQPLTTTEKGNPQCNDDFLEHVREKYVFVPLLQAYNKLIKIKGAYFDRFESKNINGIYYPSFFQHRTISGRYGSDLQQLNRPIGLPEDASDHDRIVASYNNIIRRLFISREGSAFIDSDYESLEPHVFAHCSGDEKLKDIFRKQHDFYSTIAIRTERLENVSADKSAENYLGKVDKDLRQKAKAYSLGIPYGMTDFALGKTLGIGQNEAKRLLEAYLSEFPDLRGWMFKSRQQCLKTGRIQSEAGRIRHFPEVPGLYAKYGECLLDDLELWKKYNSSPAKYRQMKFIRKKVKNALNNSVNFQIQSLSSSIVNRAAIHINRWLRNMDYNGGVVAQIHDQLVIEVPEEFKEECRAKVQEIMENTYKISIDLKSPAEIGYNFDEAH